MDEVSLREARTAKTRVTPAAHASASHRSDPGGRPFSAVDGATVPVPPRDRRGLILERARWL
ncbi:MAG: hypothetical protein AVDCRST_MAG76-937 [uncultured Acidimicrobiales bacterium]|uniref:Uncharacterized protein n=1 Tax=uncultured Acidimicrobiales bacterium TaxID=310071 RepID=A0A6J4HM52_9ACTN|nr:MAG: hypothetical protein AVDCRST_MAG76-937 [uncultured Acidimicrobiales bacterium]